MFSVFNFKAVWRDLLLTLQESLALVLMLFIVKLYSARLKKYNPIFQWETRMQALDIADECNMDTVSRNATSTVHEILLLNKGGLQTIY